MHRYYFILNPCLADRWGHQFITTLTETPTPGYYPQINGSGAHNQYFNLMSCSDRVILCEDGKRPRYIKHRDTHHDQVAIDPEEFAYIKLSSVEV